MTIFFPDVSNYQTGLSLAGAVACIAKASEGTGFTDRAYPNFKAQAQSMGIPFAAYHWLHAADVPGQARHAFSIVGPDVPLMIDDEDSEDGLSINRTLTFVTEYRRLGGTVTLEYLPRWFWSGHGSPDLRPLADAGLSLISSNYTTYSDTGPGWSPYGGVTPSIWQYTSSQPFNGMNVDFNAFKGTVEQLRTLFTGQPAPTREDDMIPLLLEDEFNPGQFWLCDMFRRKRVPPEEVDNVRYILTSLSQYPPGTKVNAIDSFGDIEAEGGGGGLTYEQTVAAAEEGANLAEDS